MLIVYARCIPCDMNYNERIERKKKDDFHMKL